MKQDQEKLSYWQAHIQGWRSSGLTQEAYCVREQLKRSTFDYWRSRIALEAANQRSSPAATAPRATLVPVQVENAADHTPLVLKNATGWQLLLPASTSTDRLAALLKSLT